MKFIKWTPRRWISYSNQRQVPFASAQMNAVNVADKAIHKMLRGGYDRREIHP